MSYQTRFLEQVKPHAFTVYKTIGILPSVTTAQAILESNWGRSTLSVQAFNFFGIKASQQPLVYMQTREVINGRSVYVNAAFQKYNSFEDCIINGYMKRVIGGDRYKRARGVKDARTAITAIFQAGYATDPSYVDKVMSVINANNLTKWDQEAIAGGDGGNFSFDGVNLDGKQFYTFNNFFIKTNSYTRPGLKLSGVLGIVLHDAGSPGLKASSIRSTLDKGNGGKRNGYHILIDNSDTVGIVPLDEVVYHTEPGETKIDILKKTSSAYPNGNGNLTTLSIGLCSNSRGEFDDAMVARAIAVCSELVNHYGLPTENIFRAFDVDGSIEPISFYNNQFDYSTFLGLVKYQRNQNTPLMNEDLQALYAGRGGEGESPSNGELIGAVAGSRQKLLAQAFEMEDWGLSYDQGRRYEIFPGGYVDCSSFTQYVYKKALGIDPGINTKAQIVRGTQIGKANVRAGDLVFWCPSGRDPSISGNVSHVGMMIDNETCIHTSYSAGPRRTIQRIAVSSMRGLTFMQYRTYVKVEGETSSIGAPSAGGDLGGIDSSKFYSLRVKSSINTYNSDSDSGTSVRRLAGGTVVDVLSIGAYGFRVGSGEWVRKKDSSRYELRERKAKNTPVGRAIITGQAPAKSAPSMSSANVLEQGRAKIMPMSSTVSVYGIENSMLRISPPEQSGIYIPQISTSYSSMLEEMPLFTTSSTDGEEDSKEVVKTTVNIRGRLIQNGESRPSGYPIVEGTVAANTSFFPLGSEIHLDIPSYPSLSGIYTVSASHDDSQKLIYLHTNDNSRVVLLGTRSGTATVENGGA